jgi:hypothetical protein
MEKVRAVIALTGMNISALRRPKREPEATFLKADERATPTERSPAPAKDHIMHAVRTRTSERSAVGKV